MTTENKPTHCSFCNTHKDSVEKFIVSDNVAICNNCIDLCNQYMKEDFAESDTESKTKTSLEDYDPLLIKDYLDQHIVGQNDAKMILSVAIANHYKRITFPPKDLVIQKGNVLLLGPTGSGKTLLAKTVAKYLNVPFVVSDATSLTEAGYVGDDVESMISMLLNAANGNVKLAERGIVFVDEVDKIARKSEGTSITRDVSGESVQQALLKLIEGTTCRIPAAGGRKHPGHEMLEIDTTNILFIAGGAFVGLKEIIEARVNGSTIGFGADVLTTKQQTDLKATTPDDLTRFGLIPELIGRFATIVSVNDLTKEELVKVLTGVKNNYIDQYKYLFHLDGVKLTFDKKALEQIADNCLKLKTGARGLHTEIERVLIPHMFNMKKYKDNNVTKINITKEDVINPKAQI